VDVLTFSRSLLAVLDSTWSEALTSPIRATPARFASLATFDSAEAFAAAAFSSALRRRVAAAF